MDEFLNLLKLQLMDRLEPTELEEEIALYRDYIDEQTAQGEPMEDVLARLGDPAKVADMIVQHETGIVERHELASRAQKETPLFKRDMTVEEINAQIENPVHGIHAEYTADDGWDVRAGKLKLNTWYGTLIIVGIVLVIFILINQFVAR